jgi:hypothetical protein
MSQSEYLSIHLTMRKEDVNVFYLLKEMKVCKGRGINFQFPRCYRVVDEYYHTPMNIALCF